MKDWAGTATAILIALALSSPIIFGFGINMGVNEEISRGQVFAVLAASPMRETYYKVRERFVVNERPKPEFIGKPALMLDTGLMRTPLQRTPTFAGAQSLYP